MRAGEVSETLYSFPLLNRSKANFRPFFTTINNSSKKLCNGRIRLKPDPEGLGPLYLATERRRIPDAFLRTRKASLGARPVRSLALIARIRSPARSPSNSARLSLRTCRGYSNVDT